MAVSRRGRGCGGLGAAKPLPPAASPRRRPGPDSGPKPPANAEKAKQKTQGRRRPAAQATRPGFRAEAASQRRKSKAENSRPPQARRAGSQDQTLGRSHQPTTEKEEENSPPCRAEAVIRRTKSRETVAASCVVTGTRLRAAIRPRMKRKDVSAARRSRLVSARLRVVAHTTAGEMSCMAMPRHGGDKVRWRRGWKKGNPARGVGFPFQKAAQGG